MRRELSANKARALLALIRQADDVGRVRLHIARDHIADIRALDARLKFTGGEIATLITASGTALATLYGIGPAGSRQVSVAVRSEGRSVAGQSGLAAIKRISEPFSSFGLAGLKNVDGLGEMAGPPGAAA